MDKPKLNIALYGSEKAALLGQLFENDMEISERVLRTLGAAARHRALPQLRAMLRSLLMQGSPPTGFTSVEAEAVWTKACAEVDRRAPPYTPPDLASFTHAELVERCRHAEARAESAEISAAMAVASLDPAAPPHPRAHREDTPFGSYLLEERAVELMGKKFDTVKVWQDGRPVGIFYDGRYAALHLGVPRLLSMVSTALGALGHVAPPGTEAAALYADMRADFDQLLGSLKQMGVHIRMVKLETNPGKRS